MAGVAVMLLLGLSVAAAESQCGSLRLIAIGDSITKGALDKDHDMPYIETTQKVLQEALGCFDVEATVAAVGGSGIHVRNLITVPERALPILHQGSWDYAIIMVGVNDIFKGNETASQVWEGGLRAMYEEALRLGTRVIAIPPLPTALVGSSEPKEVQRKALAATILDFATSRKGVFTVKYGLDWTAEQKAAWISPDHLHLKPEGYQELGRRVAEAVRAAMPQDACNTCQRAAEAVGLPPPRRHGRGRGRARGNPSSSISLLPPVSSLYNAEGQEVPQLESAQYSPDRAPVAGAQQEQRRGTLYDANGQPIARTAREAAFASLQYDKSGRPLRVNREAAFVTAPGPAAAPAVRDLGASADAEGPEAAAPAGAVTAPQAREASPWGITMVRPTGLGEDKPAEPIPRNGQCGGVGGTCLRRSNCVDNPWHDAACVQSKCERESEWVWRCV